MTSGEAIYDRIVYVRSYYATQDPQKKKERERDRCGGDTERKRRKKKKIARERDNRNDIISCRSDNNHGDANCSTPIYIYWLPVFWFSFFFFNLWRIVLESTTKTGVACNNIYMYIYIISTRAKNINRNSQSASTYLLNKMQTL